MSEPEPTKVLDTDNAADEATINISAAQAKARAEAAAQADTQRKAEAEAEAQRKADEARIRVQEREAREKALGAVPATNDDVTLPPPERHLNDKFVGSLGLALLRLTLAAILGVRGMQVLFDIEGTQTWLEDNHIPYATPIAWALGIVLLVLTLLLIIGFGVRLTGLLTAALAVAVLVFIRWGYTSVFVEGQAGFTGDWDVMVAGVGLALFCLGSGGWAVDAAMRFSRAKRKQYQ